MALELIMRIDLRRMWINQPSTLQPLHKLHGTNVLFDGDETIWFLSGDVWSQLVPDGVLSEGWLKK